MTTSQPGAAPVPSIRRFAGLEEFNAAATAARITPVGLVLPHADLGSCKPGTEVVLDWRLADGTPLVVGRAEVVETQGPRATLAVIELDPTCRVSRLFAGNVLGTQEPRPAKPDLDDSVVGLVERTYGGTARAVAQNLDVFVPPEPSHTPAPEPPPVRVAEPVPEEIDEPDVPLLGVTKERRSWRTAAILLVVATGLGLGARFSFQHFEPIVAEMLSDTPVVDTATLDVPPPGVQPSTLPPPAEPAPPPEPAPEAEPETASEVATTPAEPVPAPPRRPLDRLQSIRWEREGDTTVVTLLGNGTAYEERLLHTRLDAPQPRELLKVRGVDLPFRQSALVVGTPELQRIRVGFHPKPVANELHIVLDLPSHDVALTDWAADGATFRLVLSRRR